LCQARLHIDGEMKHNKRFRFSLRLASAFLSGISIGVGGALLLFYDSLKKLPSERETDVEKQGAVAQQVNKDEALPSWIPPTTQIVQQHSSYVSAYDTRLRNPTWSCIRLLNHSKQQQLATEEEVEKADRNNSRFRVDTSVPARFRTRPEDFKATGYDRGHLVAAADVTSQKDMDETFLMSNITPQVGAGLNRGFWLLLEKFSRKLAAKYDWLDVCSGPLFLPQYDQATDSWSVKYPVIGPRHNIAVPTHFFKCLRASRGNETLRTCFMIPNRPIDHNRESLEKFEVPPEMIAEYAGFDIFAETRSGTRSICDEVKCQLAKKIFVNKQD